MKKIFMVVGVLIVLILVLLFIINNRNLEKDELTLSIEACHTLDQGSDTKIKSLDCIIQLAIDSKNSSVCSNLSSGFVKNLFYIGKNYETCLIAVQTETKDPKNCEKLDFGEDYCRDAIAVKDCPLDSRVSFDEEYRETICITNLAIEHKSTFICSYIRDRQYPGFDYRACLFKVYEEIGSCKDARHPDVCKDAITYNSGSP